MIFTLTDRDYQALTAYETDSYLIGKYIGSIVQTLDLEVTVDSENAEHWVEGNYIMFQDKAGYKYWFTIYTANDSHEGLKKELKCYNGTIDIISEDANPIAMPPESKPFSWYFDRIFYDTGIELGTNEIAHLKRSLEFTSESVSNATMLQYVLNGFDNAEADLAVEFSGSVPNRLVLNVYKRIGKSDPQALLSDEDDSLTLLSRKRSLGGLATCINPEGENEEESEVPLTLVGKYYEEKDENGNILYYSPTDSPRIFSLKGRERFYVDLPNKGRGEFDGYINRSYRSSAKTQDSLWSESLAQLKKIDYPIVEYEAKGYLNCKIGDNIQIIAHEMKPPVMVGARITEYKFNDDDPTRNEHVLSNFVDLETNIGKVKSDLTLKIERSIKRVENKMFNQREELHNQIQTAANGKNKVFRDEIEPTEGMVVNDLWYQPVGMGEMMLYTWNGELWELSKVSAGLLGGTLDAENGDVNLINVNVSTLVGNISDFVKSYWNAINSQITIDGTKFEGRDTDGNRSVINTSGQFRSESGTDGRYGIFEKGRIWFYNEDGSAVLNIGAHPITGDTGLLKGVLATARAQRMILGRYNDYLTNNINATVNPYISFEYGATVGNEDNVYIKNWKDVSMSGKHINDVQSVEGYELAVRSTQGRLILGAPQADGSRYNTLEVGPANTISNGSIDMQGYIITNQSDIRLKTNVVDSEVNALHEIERMKFIEYDWDLENPANRKKPTGRQFGIVAQYSPFLQTKAGDSESYLSVDMSKQVNLNSKAIQELKKENDTLKQELADLKTLLVEKGLI